MSDPITFTMTEELRIRFERMDWKTGWTMLPTTSEAVEDARFARALAAMPPERAAEIVQMAGALSPNKPPLLDSYLDQIAALKAERDKWKTRCTATENGAILYVYEGSDAEAQELQKLHDQAALAEQRAENAERERNEAKDAVRFWADERKEMMTERDAALARVVELEGEEPESPGDYVPDPGENIHDTAQVLIAMVKAKGRKIECSFNGRYLCAMPATSAHDIVAGFDRAAREEEGASADAQARAALAATGEQG